MKKIKQILFFLIVLFLVGCSGQINKSNYSKIQTGMSISEVESILGEGESNASSNVDLGDYGNISSDVMKWQSGTKVILVVFSNGEVNSKSQVGL